MKLKFRISEPVEYFVFCILYFGTKVALLQQTHTNFALLAYNDPDLHVANNFFAIKRHCRHEGKNSFQRKISLINPIIFSPCQ